MPARHDIVSNQGETLNLHLLYTNTDDSAIDLNQYTAEMKVKRSFLGDDTSTVLHLTGSGGDSFTIGITAGSTASSLGLKGMTFGVTGGIFLNRNAGNSGDQTGGILIIAGATATSLIPDGRHIYDLELKYIPTGSTTRLLDGRFECPGEVTR
jgi:hypothetical protein